MRKYRSEFDEAKKKFMAKESDFIDAMQKKKLFKDKKEVEKSIIRLISLEGKERGSKAKRYEI
jgi:hypothetical protein